MCRARAGFVRNAYSGLAILAVVAFFAFGLPALDSSLPDHRPVPAGVAYPIGGTVTLVPPVGAGVDLTRTRPSAKRGTALFTLGDIRLAVVVSPYDGTLDEAAARLRSRITKAGTAGSASDPMPAGQTADGVLGLRGTYETVGRPGAYAVFIHGGVVVEVTVSGPEPLLTHHLPAFDGALATVSFGGVS
jgi:hypothetical protein